MNILHTAIVVAVVVSIIALPLITWVLYLAIMSLYRAREAGTLTSGARWPGTLVLGVGYLADFLLNVTVATILFMEIPREWLLSPRVTRLKREGAGYRQALAAWVCANLLDPFDPSGCHCK